MPQILMTMNYEEPDGATAGYKVRLHEAFKKAIILAHKSERLREKRRVGAFKIQALTRGHLVRALQRAATAARVAVVAIALGNVVVARGDFLMRSGFHIPSEIQALILQYVPVEPNVMFEDTSVLAGGRNNAISVF